jgi:N-methylhydantoinase A
MRYAGQNYELPVSFPERGAPMAAGTGPADPALLKELIARFERAHEQMYGYVAAEEPIQAVTFRLEAAARVPRAERRSHPPASTDPETAIVGRRRVWLAESGGFSECPVYDRERLGAGHAIAGPAIVEQMDATTLLLPEQVARVDRHLNLLIEG